MPDGHRQKAYLKRSLAVAAVVLVFIVWGQLAGPCFADAPADPVL